MTLESRKCVPCRGGVPALTAADAQAFLAEIPGWTLEEGATLIRRTFRFRDFAGAMAFANRVAAAAEEEAHHPDLTVGWGFCTVAFRTHAIRGLHENDFIMAAKVNALVSPGP